jgi:hypothetical protein
MMIVEYVFSSTRNMKALNNRMYKTIPRNLKEQSDGIHPNRIPKIF